MKDSFQVSEVQIRFKTKCNVSKRPKINSSPEAYDILIQSWNMDTIELFEEFKIILLNTTGRVFGIYTHSKGGLSSTVVDIRMIFSNALKGCAASIILAHNHPTGNISPSENDVAITAKIKDSGKILDIPVLDHLIISNYGYYNIAD